MHNWSLEVWGDYACFTRPEMKVERVSYDVITPSAARAIYEAILWKPAIRWHVTKIEVLKPIKWISVRRNEVGRVLALPTARQMAGFPGAGMGIYIEDARQQRAGLFLRDVHYRLHAYFDLQKQGHGLKEAGESNIEGNEAKYAAMFERRAMKGQCFHRPYLGCREFACDFRLVKHGDEGLLPPIKETRDLGFMLYDLDFGKNVEDPPALFFRAKLENGVINTDYREVEIRG